MENLVEFLSDRMSLRIPQKESLKILEEIAKTNNISYTVIEPKKKEFVIKSYADNFIKS